MPPTVDEESKLWDAGHRRIAGLDEAGRGCWAGPVVAAAVVLGPPALANPHLLDGVDDSKRLSAARRDVLRAQIIELAAGVGTGVVPAFLIDLLGIVRATKLAME